MTNHDDITDPTPIAPPLDPAPPTDTEVADLVHRLGADTIDLIAVGTRLGRGWVGWASTRLELEERLTNGHAHPVVRAAALAAYDEATGR